MKFNYHEDGTIPVAPQTVWVFGSNLAGIHGAGAALIAHRKFYAKWNKGQGWVGLFAYAIPTKGYDVQTTLPLSAIESHAMVFERMTYQNPSLKFFVTRIGCGLAGYKDEDIAPMFKDCNPDNVSFPEQWAQYLEPQVAPMFKDCNPDNVAFPERRAWYLEPQVAPLMKKRGSNEEFLAFIRGQTKSLFADIESNIRKEIKSNQDTSCEILTGELPKVKESIKRAANTLEFIRSRTNQSDEENERQRGLERAIQTLNRVRHSQRIQLRELAEQQVINKAALNTLMRERERVLPSRATA